MLNQVAAANDETTVYYVIYDDGSIGLIETTGEEPVLTRPGRLVTQAEYEERAAVLATERDTYLAQLASADEARARAAYEAYINAGFPEEVARQISGYTGPPPAPASSLNAPAEG